MPDYPELDVTEVTPLLQALIDAYRAHIKTLEARILQLEGNRTLTPVGPPLPPPRPQLRTTSSIVKALEAKHQLKEVNQ